MNTPTIYEVLLPLPPKALSSNAAVHHMVRHRALMAFKAECLAALQKRFGRFWDAKKCFYFPYGVILHYDFYCGPSAWKKATGTDDLARPRDTDRALSCVTGVQDCLVDACLIPDDSARLVSIGTVRLFRTQKEHGGRCALVLRIEAKGETE